MRRSGHVFVWSGSGLGTSSLGSRLSARHALFGAHKSSASKATSWKHLLGIASKRNKICTRWFLNPPQICILEGYTRKSARSRFIVLSVRIFFFLPRLGPAVIDSFMPWIFFLGLLSIINGRVSNMKELRTSDGRALRCLLVHILPAASVEHSLWLGWRHFILFSGIC